MNCTNCGTEIPFDERFCRNCGREVVPLAATLYAGAVPPLPRAESHTTEQYTDPMRTESLNAQPQTVREWTPPPAQVPVAPSAPVERKSMLMPITVASIIIALASIGALGYIILSKDSVNQPPPGNPSPNATPSVSSTMASPTPTAQSTPTVTPTPNPTPGNEIPPGARLGYCNDTNVFVRVSPNLNARPITKITRGQKLWIIATSTNYSTWNGINSNWTQVQLYNSSVRGWVFTPFVSY